MRKAVFLALLTCVLAGPSLPSAQVSAEFRIDLPVVLPPLVVIQPGIQVVPEQSEEVFFTDGYYWVRRDGRWWRSRSHRGGWALVRPAHVPPGLVRIPPGQYRHWHGPPPGRGPRPAAFKEERKERKERRKEERRELKEERKEDRREERGRGHGRGD